MFSTAYSRNPEYKINGNCWANVNKLQHSLSNVKAEAQT